MQHISFAVAGQTHYTTQCTNLDDHHLSNTPLENWKTYRIWGHWPSGMLHSVGC